MPKYNHQNYSVLKMKKIMCPKCKCFDVTIREISDGQIYGCMNKYCNYSASTFIEV